MAGRRVVFGRINRRNPNQETFEARSFADDMKTLADSRLTVFKQESAASRPGRTWIAGDLTLTAGDDFLTGALGFSEQQQQVSFDDEAFSWMKGSVESSDAANEATIVPFAVDLRDSERWVAFATTARLQASSFRRGFENVLNNAVAQLGLMPTAWEVDLVTSPSLIQDWLRRYPLVYNLKRTIKFTNPGKNLDEDRRQMRALAANRKTEEFAALPRKTLDIGSDEFQEKLEGTDTGDLDVTLAARGAHGVGTAKFSTRETVDSVEVADFGTDLLQGIDVVLSALREYVASRQGPDQHKLA